MVRTFVGAAPFFLASVCYAQQVTVQPSAIPGIDIVGPEAADFAASVTQIVGADQPANFAAWLPYGAVIKNNTSLVLAGITVVWTAARSASEPLGHGGGVEAEWFNEPRQRILSGQAVLVLPLHLLESQRDLRGFAEGRGLGNLQNFQSMPRIGIAVDSVVFASGQYVGADTIGEYEVYQAIINAPRSVATNVLAMKASSSISDILAWLQTVSAQPRGKDPNVNKSASTARGMLNTYYNSKKHGGEAGLYAIAEGYLQQPAFPLHR
jgi:hypothetical protein